MPASTAVRILAVSCLLILAGCESQRAKVREKIDDKVKETAEDVLLEFGPRRGTSSKHKPVYDLLVATKRSVVASRSFRISLRYPMKPTKGTRAVDGTVDLLGPPPKGVTASHPEHAKASLVLEGRLKDKGLHKFPVQIVHPETKETRKEVFELEVR